MRFSLFTYLIRLLCAFLFVIGVPGCRSKSTKEIASKTESQLSTKQLVDLVATELERRMELFRLEIDAQLDPRIYLEIARGQGTGPEDPFEADEIAIRRAKVLARMDAIRSAFPQFFCEIMPRKSLVDAIRSGIVLNTVSAQDLPGPESDIYRFQPRGSAMAITPHPIYELLRNDFLKLAGLSDAVTDNSIDWFYPVNHNPITESSECLYLILSNSNFGPSFIDQIPATLIRDTDNDGLPELIDSHGNPLRYFRWPTDYYAFLSDVSLQIDPPFPTALAADDKYLPAEYADQIQEVVGEGEELLYLLNWFHPTQLRRWNVEKGVLREFNLSAWEVLTGRTHQLYDTRANGANLELFVRAPPLIVFDVGFGFSTRKIKGDLSLNDVPRHYRRGPMVVSAGVDGKFGLYVPESGNPQGDRPLEYGPRMPMWAPLQIDYRCGRIDARNWRAVWTT